MKKLVAIVLLAFTCSGCAMLAKASLPTILVSSEQQWTIPAGTPFKAIQLPVTKELKEFIVTDADLAVLYKGNLLELEEEANSRAIKAARTAKTTGIAWGAIGTLITALGAFLAKMGINSWFQKKTTTPTK
jgi:hypothetical protein